MKATRECHMAVVLLPAPSQFKLWAKTRIGKNLSPDIRVSRQAMPMRVFVFLGERTREMDIRRIERGLIELSLTYEDCSKLERICDLALDNIDAMVAQGSLIAWIENARAAFKAAAIAGRLQVGL